MDGYSVSKIDSKDTYSFILGMHYAQRVPSISYSYGLFKDNELVGVCTIGKPASPALCNGICGKEFSKYVYELNRLITIDGLEKNVLSWFVSKVLKELKKYSLIIVSYSDEAMGHKGYIYQATNFKYLGKTKERTDKYTPGNTHSRHYSNDNNHLRKFRSSKHRYVYFTDKRLAKHLKYKEEKYPKGDNKKYKLGERLKTKIINRDTGEIWYE